MIARTVIDGKGVTVAYLTNDLAPAPDARSAAIVKLLFDDGEVAFAVANKEVIASLETLDLGAAIDELMGYAPDQPRVPPGQPGGGQFAPAGGAPEPNPFREELVLDAIRQIGYRAFKDPEFMGYDREGLMRAVRNDPAVQGFGKGVRLPYDKVEALFREGWQKGAAEFPSIVAPEERKPEAKPEEAKPVDDRQRELFQAYPHPPGPRESLLSSGKKVSSNRLYGGVNSGKASVTLDNGAKGCFKPADGEASGLRTGIEHGHQTEREVGAWFVAKAVGMEDMAPAVVDRELDGQRGAFLEWQNGEVAHHATYPYDGQRDSARAAAFDFVVGNTDRHQGNWVVENDEDQAAAKIHLIDHGLTFPDMEREGGRPLRELHSYFFYEAARITDPALSPAEMAKPFVAAEPTILAELGALGLPKGSLDGVQERIKMLAAAKTWEEIMQGLRRG